MVGFVIGNHEAEIVVDKSIIIGIKTVEKLTKVHHVAQILNYLKTTGCKQGLLENFGGEIFQIRSFNFIIRSGVAISLI